MREPTLSLDHDVLRSHVGFRSPLLVRLKLWWLGLTMRAQGVTVWAPGYRADGWKVCATGVYCMTKVRRAR